jgi:hypothetical protein
MRPLVYRTSILSLHASIVSVHGPPRFHFELLKLLTSNFDEDPDSAFHSNADPDTDPASVNKAHPCGSATLEKSLIYVHGN